MSFFDKRYTKVDEQLMQDGAEVDFGDGFFVTVRHVSAEKVSMARGVITQRVKVMSRNKELTADQQKIITSYVAANGGIVGWRGGDVPEFTPTFAEEVFKQRPEFLEDVIFAMTSFETFRKAEVEAAVGNLPQS